MKHLSLLLIMLVSLSVFVGCSEDNPIVPVTSLSPPTDVVMVTGEFSITLSWDASTFESAADFEGYNVYVDTTSIASVSDSTGAAFLEARKVNTTPVVTRSFTVTQDGMGMDLVRGQKYYLHVRSARADGKLSIASNEVDTAPRPEGSNNTGDVALLMYDYDPSTSTRSGYGWDRFAGTGAPFSTSEANAEDIDFFMVEEANSADDGSEFVSPAQASFTSGWTIRNETLFKDLGAGDDAWNTSIAPDVADMTTKVKVIEDHTYALYTHDMQWIKVRVTNLDPNVPVNASGGGTVNLNQATFDYAYQLLNDYGRFKPGLGGAN